MANLRALTTDTVCRYHVEYYMFDICIFILTGNMQSNDFFAALYEAKALALRLKLTTEVEAQNGRRWRPRTVVAWDGRESIARSRPWLSTAGSGSDLEMKHLTILGV